MAGAMPAPQPSQFSQARMGRIGCVGKAGEAVGVGDDGGRVGDEVGAYGRVSEEGGRVLASAGVHEEAEAACCGLRPGAILRAAGERDDELEAAVACGGQHLVHVGESRVVEVASGRHEAQWAADAGAEGGHAGGVAAEGLDSGERVLNFEEGRDAGAARVRAQAEPGEVGACEADRIAQQGEVGVGAAHEIARVGGRGHGRKAGRLVGAWRLGLGVR